MKNRISEIEVIPVKPSNGLVGFASFVYDESFYLGSIGIRTRLDGGYRLTYPTKTGNQFKQNVFYPITKRVGKLIEKEVIKKFEEVMKSYVGYSCDDNTKG